MKSIEKDFFRGKREWSRLKDQVLREYLPPYLKKVNILGKKIILIDSFAGPGLYEKNEEPGSPLIFCKTAEEIVPNNYLAILVNQEKTHHLKLTNALNGFIKSKKALPILGNALDLLNTLLSIINDQTIFIYLDPFGLKGTDFDTLKKILGRDRRFSTELLINLSIPTIIRYSCINSFKEKGLTEDIKKKHEILNKTLGGEYWKDFLLDTNLTASNRRAKIVREYVSKIRMLLPYVGYCKVYEKGERSRLKYVIIHASRHPDALVLMNNCMFKAYWQHIWKNYALGTLFEELSWTEALPREYYQGLEIDILKLLAKYGSLRRKELELKLFLYKFMRYNSKDFNHKIKELKEKKIIGFIDTKKTGKLNDESIIFLE